MHTLAHSLFLPTPRAHVSLRTRFGEVQTPTPESHADSDMPGLYARKLKIPSLSDKKMASTRVRREKKRRKKATTGPETRATVNASLTPVPSLTATTSHSGAMSSSIPNQQGSTIESRYCSEEKKPHRVSVARFGCLERQAVQCREVRRGTPSCRSDPEDCRARASAILKVEEGPLAFYSGCRVQ